MSGTSPAPCQPQPVQTREQPPASLSGSVVPSEQILQGHRSVAIAHNGSVYRLQATRQGKLILTK